MGLFCISLGAGGGGRARDVVRMGPSARATQTPSGSPPTRRPHLTPPLCPATRAPIHGLRSTTPSSRRSIILCPPLRALCVAFMCAAVLAQHGALFVNTTALTGAARELQASRISPVSARDLSNLRFYSPPSNMIDGDESTPWNPDTVDTYYLEFTLGSLANGFVISGIMLVLYDVVHEPSSLSIFFPTGTLLATSGMLPCCTWVVPFGPLVASPGDTFRVNLNRQVHQIIINEVYFIGSYVSPSNTASLSSSSSPTSYPSTSATRSCTVS